jgi:two-component system phosphate regulon sensor histidine kinase PhoR
MADSALLGLRAAAACLAVTVASLAAPLLVPEAAGRSVRLGVSGVALALAGAVFWWLTRRLAQSLIDVITVARAIGAGDYRRRLHLAPSGELAALAEAINQMARGIEGQIATITDQKVQLQAILDGMREGVMVLDASGRIRVVNPALVRMLPISGLALGRRPIEVAQSPELQRACDRLLTEPEASPLHPPTLEVELTPGRFHEVSLVLLRPDHQDPGVVLVYHDVSETRRLARVRRDFAANVTHELRTPLTSIKGYAETLLTAAPELSPEKRRFLDVIVRNANHMSKMVEDILDLARLEEGPAGGPVETTADPGVALAEAVRECESLAGAKELVLENLLAPDTPPVRCDAGQLSQVWRNLLENATRFGPKGSKIVMTATFNPDTVTCSVQDQGPGIPPEERQRVFERFYRVERHRSKATGSTGLGLAIVKHIVERHGGRVWADRGRGEMTGAAFFFTLPRADGGAQAAP